MDEEVGAGNDQHELGESEERVGAGEKDLDGDRIGGVRVGGDRLTPAAHLGKLELLVGVRGVVRPLPRQHV